MFLSWQAFGNLGNSANAGLWYVNGDNALSNANWNIGSRLSGWHPLSFPSHLPRARQRATRHARSTQRNGLKTTGPVAESDSSAGNQRGARSKVKTYCKGLVMDRSHIATAYGEWLRSRSGRKNSWRVAREHGSADALIDEIATEIRDRSLTLRPIRRYRHIEPTNGKMRSIGVESVKQQVLDYAIVLAMRPLLDAKVGHWQVAGVPGKGQRAARRALRKWVREGGYHVKLDIRKCYPSISHDVVRRIVGRYVGSTDVLYCVESVLSTYGCGLEIGSYFSLQMSNLVISFGYHHVEGLGKTRRGRWVPLVSHQIWHMDDCLLLGRDKRNLKMAARALVRHMRECYGLDFKPWKVARTGEVELLDMGGYRVRERRCTLRSALFARAKRAFARFARFRTLRLAQRACSYWGWLRHADTDGFIRRNGIARLFEDARRAISRAGKEGACITPRVLAS